MTALRNDVDVARLVHDNRKLVDYMVNRYLKRYYVGTMERDDLVSWGMMGLVNAARAWDPRRSRSFSTLACRAIERMIIRGVNREWRPDREQGNVSLDQLISGNSGEGDDRFVDQLPADENVERQMLRTERDVALRTALGSLSEEQRTLIERHYFKEESVENIARDLGISRQGVYSREKAIFKQLRDRLGDSHALAA
jgi:RNA polymerase sigma factor (sigma-70 family)